MSILALDAGDSAPKFCWHGLDSLCPLADKKTFLARREIERLGLSDARPKLMVVTKQSETSAQARDATGAVALAPQSQS